MGHIEEGRTGFTDATLAEMLEAPTPADRVHLVPAQLHAIDLWSLVDASVDTQFGAIDMDGLNQGAPDNRTIKLQYAARIHGISLKCPVHVFVKKLLTRGQLESLVESLSSGILARTYNFNSKTTRADYRFTYRPDREGDILYALSADYGRQVWALVKTRKEGACILCGRPFCKGDPVYRPLTNAKNRNERIDRDCPFY